MHFTPANPSRGGETLLPNTTACSHLSQVHRPIPELAAKERRERKDIKTGHFFVISAFSGG
jgi:hypothetical protein